MKSNLAIAALVILTAVMLILLFRSEPPPAAPEGVNGAADVSKRAIAGLGRTNTWSNTVIEEEADGSTAVGLFLDDPAASSCSSESARRSRTARLNSEGVRGLSAGEELDLNLFDDYSCRAKISDSYKDVNGAEVVTGTVDPDDPRGYLYMSTFGGKTVAFVDAPADDRIFSAGTGNGIDYSIFDQDRSKMDIVYGDDDMALLKNVRFQDGTPFAGNANLAAPPASAFPESDPGSTVIDVVFIYTRSAKAWAEASYMGPIENILAIAVARANTAFSSSKTGVRLRLVHSQEVTYRSSGENKGNSLTDLCAVTTSDAVREIRDKYGADIVTLVTATDDTGGIGWLYNGNADYGYNVCRVKQLATSYTYAHECGHNLGCGHFKSKSGDVPGFFSYSYGWQWTGTDGKGYHSVMTYSSSAYPVDVPYFSSPSIISRGRATGNAKDANNALTIIRIKGKVAAYRESITGPEQE